MMGLTNQDFLKILHIGIQLSVETDSNKLINAIVEKAVEVTGSDCGALFLCKENKLQLRIMRIVSRNFYRGADGELAKDMPDVVAGDKTACSYVAHNRVILNIPSIQNCDKFNFKHYNDFERRIGYRTESLLVVPLENNKGELLGVLQVGNAMDALGSNIPFTKEHETVVQSMGSLAAIALSNVYYLGQSKKQLNSFVEAMSTAIDERSPYNGHHTRKVTEYVLMLARKINEKYEAGECDQFFDGDRQEKLRLAAQLHDLGKIIVPRSIMNRASRLDREMPGLQQRYQLIRARWQILSLQGSLSRQDYEKKLDQIQRIQAFIDSINNADFLNDKAYDAVQKISQLTCPDENGNPIPYLTEEEREHLSVRKGTLTAKDRKTMENHVVMTSKILSKVYFTEHYKDVPRWAGEHHEFLDGSGYPRHLKADQLDLETRILTVADIFDALTSPDRPYKKPLSKEQAFHELHSMANDGKVEDRLVSWMEEAVQTLS